MSALPNFDPSLIKVNIEKLISLYFDFDDGPAKKLREVLKEKQSRPAEDIAAIIREVSESNICHKVEYRRRGKRRLLWGLWEAEPEEKESIHIRGHFVSRKLLET